jgi:DNA-binding NarL/FixJ family response regulator
MKPTKPGKPLQITLVEDDSGIRATLSGMINETPGFHCLETYPDAESALKGIPYNRPDVVLMDINLPGMSGVDCVGKLKAAAPGLPVLMLTVYDDSDMVFKSLMAGADGYLLKRTSREKLLESIQESLSGGAPMSRQIARRVIQFFHEMRQKPDPAPATKMDIENLESLTEREYEILANLAKGFTYKEIATAVSISVETVRSHIRKIYEKLQVHSRTEAVLKFVKQSGN